MFEKAEYSLARVGVMIGLSSLVVLGAGFFMNVRVETMATPMTHFSIGTWKDAQSVLRHVSPSSSPTSLPTRTDAICAPGRPGYPKLERTVGIFNGLLGQLMAEKFLGVQYQLELTPLLLDPDHQVQRCDQIAKTIHWIIDRVQLQGLAFLESLVWKERTAKSAWGRLQGNEWVAMPKNSLTTHSAWSGLPGCIYWTDAATGRRVVAQRADTSTQAFCQSQTAAADAVSSPWATSSHLPGFRSLIDSLSGWRSPQHARYADLVGAENLAIVQGKKQTVGLHAQLSIDPGWQAQLQGLAECFSGKVSLACSGYAAQSEGRYEKARVRMVGISVVDVATGRLVAAASSDSPCYAHDKTRIGPAPADCPTLPEDTVHRPRIPQPTVNHALFSQAPPGSLVKPLLMAGIVQYNPADAGIVGLEQALQRSDSQQFLDAFLCRQKLGSGTFAIRCDRPELTQRSAHLLGWNSGCERSNKASFVHCGFIDLMLGVPESVRAQPKSGIASRQEPGLSVLMGQTLVSPNRSARGMFGYSDMQWPDSLPSPEQRQACAKSGPRGYVRCSGNNMGAISEAYGQGNTIATPVGVAGMLAALANSAQQQGQRYPHLLVDLFNVDGKSDASILNSDANVTSLGPLGIDANVARRIVSAMEKTHLLGGTAHAACVHVYGKSGCNIERGIAGKTGTPGDADERSLSQLARDMQLRADCIKGNYKNCAALLPLPRPRYRWYAALFKSSGSVNYDKAIAILVHSNWRRSDGRYADEQNAAAEIAMYAMRHFQRPMDPS
jgi:cell division protein FtsI/penicillin-binding protein 2